MKTLQACWNCGVENPITAKFCTNCGKPQKSVCPSCGSVVLETAKFCPDCGIPLGASPGGTNSTDAAVLTAESRKIVTVLFADLVGSTGLTEKLDPEEARQVVRKFYDVVQHVVERWFAGTVANFLGDGVLAVFGLPAAHEDDPERAVRAGLSIRDAMPVLNSHLAATHGIQLAVRVGINTGEVVAASGSTFDKDFLIADAVTTAARFQQTVAPGMVVVGERTYRLTRETIEYRDLPPQVVKGKNEALTVWEAVSPLPERAERRRDTTPLVGRQAEFGLLRHLYRQSCDDARIRLVTILGDPGIGKSRLLREFLGEIRDSNPQPYVLRGRSVAFGGQIGYHALLDILRSQAGLLNTDSPADVRDKLRTWLEGQLPTQAGLLDGLMLTFGTEGDAAGTPAQLRERLFDCWERLIRSLAEHHPMVLAFDDLHWADENMLDLVQRFAESPEAVPLLIVCLARPELIERRPTWAAGRRNATAIDLTPLRPEEIKQLVSAFVSQGLSPAMQQAVAERAEGNPLFVEELLQMLLEGSTPVTIPDTVQAVLSARIDRLPPIERRVLQAAAVVGRTFWPSAIGPIAGGSAGETSEAIAALIGKELIVGRPRSIIADEREYVFRHVLIRDVAYNMLPKSQRQRAHAETAGWIEQHLKDRLEEVIEILAEHVRLSGDNARAAIYLLRAGNKARRLYANANALHLFDQSLEAATKAGLPSREIAEIYRARGEVHQLAGNYASAMGDFVHAQGAAQQAADRALEAVLENRIGMLFHRELRLEEAEAHFVRAAALARNADDRRTLGKTLIDLANIAWDRGSGHPDHPAMREGLDLLRGVGDHSALAQGLNLLGMVHLGAGNGDEALAAIQSALAEARVAQDKSREATSLSYLCVIHGFLGRYRVAIPFGQAAMELAQNIGDRRRQAYSAFFIGRVQAPLGELGGALKHLKESLDLSKDIVRIHLPWVTFYMGLTYHELGDLSQARDTWAAAATLETHSPAWRQVVLLSAIGAARLSQDAVAVNRALDEFLQLPFSKFLPTDADALLPVGEALLESRRVEELRRFVAERRPGLEKLSAPQYLAGLDILEAHLAVEAHDTAGAVARLDRAIRLTDQSEDVLRGWRAHELRLQLRHEPADREALRGMLTRVSISLPGELQETFRASPRAATLLT